MVKAKEYTLAKIVFGAVMAAIICVINFLRIPVGHSQLHFTNSLCLLAGLLLGPVTGGLAAGLGSALFDVLGGYDPLTAVITFVSKFAMAWVASMLYGAWKKKHDDPAVKETILPLVLCCAAGALTYVALYMLKSWLFITLGVEHLPEETTLPALLIGKLVPSLINAAFAIATAPVFYHAVRPALKSVGAWRKLEAVNSH